MTHLENSHIVAMHVAYLVISIVVTVWVARTLFRNGRIFLVETFRGHEELADSVNRLLVVGFYLINIGFVSIGLRFGPKPHDLSEIIENLSTKIGIVLLILGGMHFFNLLIFSRMRRKAVTRDRECKPPVLPDERTIVEPAHA